VSVQDYRITAEVRRRLVSHWVDVSRLQIGTTNGTVYIIGILEPAVEDALERSGVTAERGASERLIRLASIIEKELRRVRDVRDVVFNFKNLRKRGRTWAVVGDGAGRRPMGPAGTQPTATRTETGTYSISDGKEDDDGEGSEPGRR
jgi:hypothetical protein